MFLKPLRFETLREVGRNLTCLVGVTRWRPLEEVRRFLLPRKVSGNGFP